MNICMWEENRSSLLSNPGKLVHTFSACGAVSKR